MISYSGKALFVTVAFLVSATRLAAADENAAVRRAIQQYVDAREQASETALQDLFTQDADQLVSTGEWRRGKDAVVAGTVAASKRATGHRSVTIETLRFLAKDVALADGRYELTDQAGNVTRKMWTCFLLKRERGRWRIAGIRNMLPAK